MSLANMSVLLWMPVDQSQLRRHNLVIVSSWRAIQFLNWWTSNSLSSWLVKLGRRVTHLVCRASLSISIFLWTINWKNFTNSYSYSAPGSNTLLMSRSNSSDYWTWQSVYKRFSYWLLAVLLDKCYKKLRCTFTLPCKNKNKVKIAANLRSQAHHRTPSDGPVL